MIIDWHTNLWLDEHIDVEHLTAMHVRSGGRATDASPDRHRRTVAAVAEKFIVITMKWPRLGVNVPNDFVAQYVAQFPGRAIGLACVEPRDPNAERELERAVKVLGLRGLKLAPTYQGFDPWCEDAWKLYDLCNQLKIPILWHQASAFPSEAILEYGDPIYIDKIARNFPKLKMILAHFGLPWANIVVQLMRKHKQIFTDVSARIYRPWEMYNAMLHALDYAVTDQILFGSDFPVQTTEEALKTFRDLRKYAPGLPPIPEKVIESIINDRPLELIWS
jgi:uncharacterized protein